MALHERQGATDEWYTPEYIFDALNCRFNMDVASPGRRATPWIPADAFLSINSLEVPWRGFVWMNPPFGPRNGLVPWLEKFFDHGSGICLVPDRTSAPWWQDYVSRSDYVLFVTPKIGFVRSNGVKSKTCPQGTCLCAVGPRSHKPILRAARTLGTLMKPMRS